MLRAVEHRFSISSLILMIICSYPEVTSGTHMPVRIERYDDKARFPYKTKIVVENVYEIFKILKTV
jgi:hypothetical protein